MGLQLEIMSRTAAFQRTEKDIVKDLLLQSQIRNTKRLTASPRYCHRFAVKHHMCVLKKTHISE